MIKMTDFLTQNTDNLTDPDTDNLTDPDTDNLTDLTDLIDLTD